MTFSQLVNGISHRLATLICPVNTCGNLFAVCPFASAESIIHEAIAQPHSVLGFSENHGGGRWEISEISELCERSRSLSKCVTAGERVDSAWRIKIALTLVQAGTIHCSRFVLGIVTFRQTFGNTPPKFQNLVRKL